METLSQKTRDLVRKLASENKLYRDSMKARKNIEYFEEDKFEELLCRLDKTKLTHDECAYERVACVLSKDCPKRSTDILRIHEGYNWCIGPNHEFRTYELSWEKKKPPELDYNI